MNARSWFSLAMFLCSAALSAAETTHGRRLTPNDVDLWQSGAYRYDGSGNIYEVGGDSYRYDLSGRIVDASVASHPQTFRYDVFGNVTQVTTGSDVLTPAVNPLTNQLAPTGSGSGSVATATYDLAGNMIVRDGVFHYAYDATNMVTTLTGPGQEELYIYGPGEQRIATVTSIHAQAPHWSWTLRDGAHVLRRLDSSGASTAWSEDYVYRAGGVLATIQSDGSTRHFHLDHLGSARVVTNDQGRAVSRHTYYPFGREIDPKPSDEEKVRFTGHERDASLDYMHARYYTNVPGRFLTVDPLLDIEKTTRTPQSWNRYSYVTNNPARFVDLDGRSETDVVYRLVRFLYREKKIIGFETTGTITRAQAVAARELGKSVQVTAKTEKQALRVANEIENAAYPDSPNLVHGRDAHMNGGNQAHVQSEGEKGHTYFRTFAAQPLRTAAELLGSLLIPLKVDIAIQLTRYGMGEIADGVGNFIEDSRKHNLAGSDNRFEKAADQIEFESYQLHP